MDARKFGVRAVLSIQDEVNEAAAKLGRPGMDLINEEELERIKELIELNTWPNGWDGDEISGSEDIPDYYADGTVQPLLFRKEGAA
jgi:DNA sulfur modification protein DndC